MSTTTETQPQSPMMNAQPQKQHQWLHKLIGEWTYEHEAEVEPGKPPQKFTGTERIRSLGGLWIIAEGHGNMPGGGEANTILTIGYDPQKERFVGTWIGSMMTYLWVYDGDLDSAGRTLTLNTEGPSMAGDGKMLQYREIIEFKSDDYRTFTSQVRGEDGQWREMMTAHNRRKK